MQALRDIFDQIYSDVLAMQFDPHLSDRQRRILTLAGMATIAFVLSTPSHGQDDADVDLKPADFVSEEPVAIRVDDLQPSDGGSVVSVTILNRTNEDTEQVVECTLYDADREDLGVAVSKPFEIGTKQEAPTTVMGPEGAKYAECLVRASK